MTHVAFDLGADVPATIAPAQDLLGSAPTTPEPSDPRRPTAFRWFGRRRAAVTDQTLGGASPSASADPLDTAPSMIPPDALPSPVRAISHLGSTDWKPRL